MKIIEPPKSRKSPRLRAYFSAKPITAMRLKGNILLSNGRRNMRNKPTKIHLPCPSITMSATIFHRGEKGEINFQNEPKKCIRLPYIMLHRLFFASFPGIRHHAPNRPVVNLITQSLLYEHLFPLIYTNFMAPFGWTPDAAPKNMSKLRRGSAYKIFPNCGRVNSVP
jgi:hypothetical protein